MGTDAVEIEGRAYSFAGLMEIHAELDELFFQHQAALLRSDLGEAIEMLETFERALFAHMKDEEELLLPVYAKLGEFAGAGNPRFFYDDHEKMRGFIEAFRQKTYELSAVPEPERQMLALLDREAFFKRLCSHHDKRESEHLYTILDRELSEGEKRALLSKLTCRGRQVSTNDIRT